MHTVHCLILTATLAQTPPQTAGPAQRGVPPAARETSPRLSGTAFSMEALQRQVMLDRAGFSPGVIDGRGGPNTAKAFAAFQRQGATAGPPADPISRYVISPEDAAGPFLPIPEDMIEKSKLPALGYASLLEMLAERFHASPALLQQMNPGVELIAGQALQVPNVEPMLVPVASPAKAPASPAAPAARSDGAPEPAQAPPPTKPDVVITVSKATRAMTVTSAEGATVFYAPVTTGSEHDPLPIGEWKVNGAQRNPTFHYNPALFWDSDPEHAKAKIPGGPNNPVGLVWIDISKEHYGLHGTPEPRTIGRTESHGCVRLTNWDALRLAALVKPGTRVVFTE